jgi:quinol monooxygenase YgiN
MRARARGRRRGRAPAHARRARLREHSRVPLDAQSETVYIHSRWVDEAAFELHATLPHTLRFLERAEKLIDHPLDVTRAMLVD